MASEDCYSESSKYWIISDLTKNRHFLELAAESWSKQPCHFESPYLKNYLCDLFLDGTVGKSTIEIYWYMKRSWIITLGFSYDRRFRTNYFFECAFLVSMWVSDGCLGGHELWWGWIDFRGAVGAIQVSIARNWITWFSSNSQNFFLTRQIIALRKSFQKLCMEIWDLGRKLYTEIWDLSAVRP